MSSAAPARHRFTVEEYYRMAEAAPCRGQSLPIAGVTVDVDEIVG